MQQQEAILSAEVHAIVQASAAAGEARADFSASSSIGECSGVNVAAGPVLWTASRLESVRHDVQLLRRCHAQWYSGLVN